MGVATQRGWSGLVGTRSFADRLKTGCINVLGLPRAMFYDAHLKEALFEVPIELDKYLERFSAEFELALKPQGKLAKNPREVLQFIGTEYVRSEQDDYWLNSLLRGITTCHDCRRNVPHECSVRLKGRATTPGLHLIPDCRFLNEAEAIKSVGGKVIRIVREGMPEGDGHRSEMEMALIEPDVTILTPHMLEGPNQAALKLFNDPESFFQGEKVIDLR